MLVLYQQTYVFSIAAPANPLPDVCLFAAPVYPFAVPVCACMAKRRVPPERNAPFQGGEEIIP